MRRPRDTRRGLRWASAAGVPAVIALVEKRRELGLPRVMSAALAACVPAAVAATVPRGRLRAAATWSAHMWAYGMLFMTPYDAPDKLGRRLRVGYPIKADAILGAGVPLPERAQRNRRRGELRSLDVAASAVYALWEAEPHLILAWLLFRRPERFVRAAARLALVFDLTLVAYWVVPTAPPWFASEERGQMHGRVRRLVVEVGRWVWGRPRPRESHRLGKNPWAAMPSDHFASAVAIATIAWESDRRVGAAAWTYAAALGSALVYLGEHYAVDLAAGVALAEAVRLSEPLWGEPLERALVAFPSLAEP